MSGVDAVELINPHTRFIHRALFYTGVANAPVLCRPAYGGGTYGFLPESLLSLYEWQMGDDLWRIQRAIIRGHRMRGDEPSSRWSETVYGLGDLREAPQWARGLVLRHRPQPVLRSPW